MVPAEEYRRNAEQCLRLATIAIDCARKAHLIAEAKGWLSLSVFAARTGPRHESRRARSRWRSAGEGRGIEPGPAHARLTRP